MGKRIHTQSERLLGASQRSRVATIAYAAVIGTVAGFAVASGNPVILLPVVIASLPFSLAAFPLMYVLYGIAEQIARAAGVSAFAHAVVPPWFHIAFSVGVGILFAGAAIANVRLVRVLHAHHRVAPQKFGTGQV
jgi:uncharacterized membrane protein